MDYILCCVASSRPNWASSTTGKSLLCLLHWETGQSLSFTFTLDPVMELKGGIETTCS